MTMSHEKAKPCFLIPGELRGKQVKEKVKDLKM